MSKTGDGAKEEESSGQSEKQQYSFTSDSPYELLLLDDAKSRPLSKTTEDGTTTASAYHIALPESWGSMVVHYEQRPPIADEEDAEKDLRLIFRMGNAEVKEEEPVQLRPPSPKVTPAGAKSKKSISLSDSSGSSPLKSIRAEKAKGSINKYVQVDWNEWKYVVKKGEKEPMQLPVEAKKSASGKRAKSASVPVKEQIQHLRAQFDAMLHQLGDAKKSPSRGSKKKQPEG